MVAAIVVLALILLAFAFQSSLNGYARAKFIEDFRQRYHGEPEFGELDIRILPRPHIVARNIVVRFKGRRDVPPLIQIQSLSARSGVISLLLHHINYAHLEGLQIHVPPRDERASGGKEPEHLDPRISKFVIDEVTSDNAYLEILPGHPDKAPLPFSIEHLRLGPFAMDRPADFHAVLTNPRPKGLIEASGKFGPWQRDDPGETSLSGSYTLSHADLATFKGIAGTLSSNGKFAGKLNRMEADGETDTPDFMVRISGHPLPLHTRFHAIIDGTNGDTLLRPVYGQFLHSEVLARGGVVGNPGEQGHSISLDVVVSKGRLEDMLRLGLRGQPPMTGNMSFHAKLSIPAADVDVIDKLQLDGQFGVAGAQFTQLNVEEKVKDLSRRAEGEPGNPDAGSAVSNLHGKFSLRNAVIHFSSLTFSVEGASVQLDGSFGIHDEKLDFHGTARLEAKVSQTQTGFKSVLLKAVDPFFKKKGAGAVVPIRITGTRENPSFGLDFGRKH